MEKTSQKLIRQLNYLVEINNDRIDGYTKAETETDDPELKTLFTAMATHSHDFKEEISGEIRSINGIPATGTTTSGKLHRAWMDIKAALTGRDRKEILKSCEAGEMAAIETYNEVLNSDVVFTGSLKKMILDQKQIIQEDSTKIKILKESVLTK